MRSDPSRQETGAAALFAPGAYISGLDGLRAVAVLLVLVGHLGFEKLIPGGLGVTVFFFISGFLITTLLTREARAYGTISISKFYMRRIIRLYPELILLIVLGGAVGLFLYHGVRPIDVAGALGYFTNYLVLHDEVSGVGPGPRWPHLWSLAVEEHFYLTFPLLMWASWRRRGLFAAVLGLVCVAALAWRFHVHAAGAPFGLSQDVAQPYTALASEARIDSIAYGCLASLLFQQAGEGLSRRPTLALAAGVAGAAGLLFSLAWRDEVFRYTWRYSLQGLALTGCFIGLYLTPAGAWIRRAILDQPLMRRLGALSYGAYLWHMEIVLACGAWAGRAPLDLPLSQKVALTLAGAVLSFLLAEASLRAVAPVQRLRHQLFSR